MVMTLGDT